VGPQGLVIPICGIKLVYGSGQFVSLLLLLVCQMLTPFLEIHNLFLARLYLSFEVVNADTTDPLAAAVRLQLPRWLCSSRLSLR
jgi:hypothetical protein